MDSQVHSFRLSHPDISYHFRVPDENCDIPRTSRTIRDFFGKEHSKCLTFVPILDGSGEMSWRACERVSEDTKIHVGRADMKNQVACKYRQKRIMHVVLLHTFELGL